MDEVINDPTAAEDDRNADQDRDEQGHDFLLSLLKSKRYVNANPRGLVPFPYSMQSRRRRTRRIKLI
jgi:hypothetical protein